MEQQKEKRFRRAVTPAQGILFQRNYPGKAGVWLGRRWYVSSVAVRQSFSGETEIGIPLIPEYAPDAPNCDLPRLMENTTAD